MYRSLSIALLAGGVILIILGFIAADSLASSFSKFFTGSPTDKSIWMLIIGVVLIAISGFGFYGGSRETR